MANARREDDRRRQPVLALRTKEARQGPGPLPPARGQAFRVILAARGHPAVAIFGLLRVSHEHDPDEAHGSFQAREKQMGGRRHGN